MKEEESLWELEVVEEEILQLFRRWDPWPKPILDLNISFEEVVTPEISTWLYHYPMLDEVKLSLVNMPRVKAPTLDGITVEVLVHHWDTVKEGLISAILYYFNPQRMLTSLNHTFLHTPSLSKSLISVHMFASDYSCYFVFYPLYFCVKD